MTNRERHQADKAAGDVARAARAAGGDTFERPARNEYGMEPGQARTVESEVVQATGHATLYFVVRLKADCLSDGSVAHDVEADLCSGGLRIVTWTWHPATERDARRVYDQVHKDLDTTRRPTRPEFGFGPDDVDEAVPDSDSVCMALGLAWAKGFSKAGAKGQADLKKAVEAERQAAEDLRKRLQVQTRLASEAMDARDRLEGELRDAKDDINALKDAWGKRRMKAAHIVVTKQVTGRDTAIVDDIDDRVMYAYLGQDPTGRAVAIIPMLNNSIALRAQNGDEWTVKHETVEAL